MADIATPVPQAPSVDEPVSEVGQLSQTTLMRLRFTRNKLAMFSLYGLIIMYVLVFYGTLYCPQ